ncbi:MAG: TIGR03546 family protein [Bacteroidetes bacterium]|nr:TIGR03546 family protein [Bacteroidota bacterium]
MFWLSFIRKFLKILAEGQTPKQIALGFALGSLIGLSPMLTLQGLLIWIIILILDVNISAAIVAVTLFKIIAFIFDPAFHAFGFFILTLEPFKDFFTTLYNVPVAPLTRFNNTLVMGSFISAVILFIPVYFSMKFFVIKYREKLHEKIIKWKIYKIIKQSSMFRYYEKVKSLGGLR